MELNSVEIQLIEIIRHFSFLTQYGYREDEFFFFGRSYPTLWFKNDTIQQRIGVVGNDFGCEKDYSVIFIRKGNLFNREKNFSVDKYIDYSSVNLLNKSTIETFANYINHNMIPIVKGELWID